MSPVYIRLLRFPDQFTQLSSSVIAALFYSVFQKEILLWFFSITCLSITAFIVNELVDRNDVDKYSWSKVHIVKEDILDMRIVATLFALFTFLGLYSAFQIGLFWIALFLWILGVSYSLPPIRLKARFGWDVVALLGVWWILPTIGVFKLTGVSDYGLYLFATSAMAWSCFFPYTLADFTADKKGGLHATHVVIGMRSSLLFGLTTGILGWLSAIYLLSIGGSLWLSILLVMQTIALGYYIFWFHKNTNHKTVEQSMQRGVMLYKPLAMCLTIGMCSFFILKSLGILL